MRFADTTDVRTGPVKKPAGGATPPSPTSSRLASLDIVRGYCILSMIFGHLAGSTWLAKTIHAFPQFDGASGFVLLSGLVLGIVQHRRMSTRGLRSVQLSTIRRVGVILIAAWSITAVGVAVALSSPVTTAGVPQIDRFSPVEVLWRSAILAMPPPAGNVLGLYVVFLIMALGAYLLLARGHQVWVLTLSIALYVVSFFSVSFTSFRASDGVTLGANVAGWQLLFFTALLIGWNWSAWDVAGKMARRAWLWIAVCLAVTVCVRAVDGFIPGFFDKLAFAPGRIVEAYAVTALLYLVVSVCLRVVPRWTFRPLEMVGRRGLDSYIIQAVVAVIVPSFVVAVSKQSVWGAVAACVTFALCWAWSEARDRRSSAALRPDTTRAALAPQLPDPPAASTPPHPLR